MTLHSLRAGTAVVLLCAAALVPGQSLQMGGAANGLNLGPAEAVKKPHVALLSDSLAVPAGRSTEVELRFAVDSGFHINSHRPKDELLIPTVLHLDSNGPVRVQGETYPPGTMFHLSAGAGEDLNVYQGEFRVRVFVVVPKGASTLEGSLHYQACDRAACYPPRTLPVRIAVTGQ